MKKQSVMALNLLLPFFITVGAQASVPKKLNSFPEGERLVYTRLVEAFHHNKLADLIKERHTLQHNYPTSVHLDNAFYLSGLLELQNNLFGEAIKSFDVVRTKFLKSNKRPSAMLATAVAYQRMNLTKQAHRLFEQVQAEYPGSQESQRAWMSLRAENLAGKNGVKAH